MCKAEYVFKHEPKACPRCGKMFKCKAGDVLNCQCSQVGLSEETYAYLASSYYDCLCKQCLSELELLVCRAGKLSFPSSSEALVENLHYYKEGTKFVFTEFYHVQRGYCCNSGCRHCAYGYKKALT